MVDFKYRDQEIRVAGKLYPVVEMDWAEGQPLHLWVEQHLQYPHDLVRLAAIWLKAVKDLQARGMAHGDLSSDNCLVTWNKLTLIDYDSFFIPELAGSNPGEAGNPHFQHPDRKGYYALNMDAFPALVIYLSLLALAADKSLWEFHNGKNLIFTAEDYVSPRKTPLWRALARSPDKRIVPLLIALEDMCGSGIDVLPPLSQVAAESSVTWGRAWWPVRAGGPRRLGQHLRRLRPSDRILRRVRTRRAAWLVACAAVLVFLGLWLTAGGSPTTSDINSVAFSPDSKTMAAVDANGGVYLWDIPARHRVATLADPGNQAVVSVAFSPDGKTLAVVDADGSIYLWGIPARNLVVTLSASTDRAVKSAAFSPDGKTLATADADGSVYLWDIPARSLVATVPDPGKQAVVSVAFSPDGKTLATADAAGVTYLWDVPARTLVATLPDPGKQAVNSAAFSPDGKTLATGDADGVTYLWGIPASSLVATLPDPGKQAVVSVAFSPDGKALATADAAGGTYLWGIPAKP
jgi:sugar lactone lactonase YvrE